MRLSLTVVDGRTGRAVDSLVDLDPAQPVGDLVQPLTELLGDRVHSGFARRVPLWVDGVAVEPDRPPGSSGSGTAAWCPLRARRPGGREVPHGVAELRVVSGPGAGRIHRLPLGDTVVGCGAPGWSLPDLRLPSDALTVSVAPDGSVAVTAPDALGPDRRRRRPRRAGGADPVAGRRVRLRG